MSFPPANDPTSPNAKPDYDGLGIDSQWSPDDWMTWHAALVTAYGPDEANHRFVAAWNGGGFFETPPQDARTFDSSFREFARKNGILDALYSGIGIIAKPIGVVNDLFDTTTALGGGIKSTGQSLGSSLKWWVLGAVALALAFYIIPASLARAAKTAAVK